MATELTIVLTLSAVLFKIRSPSSHIPDTLLTSCSLSMLVYLYLHPFKKPMVQQSTPAHAKPEPVSPRSCSLASSIHQSEYQSSLARSWNPAP